MNTHWTAHSTKKFIFRIATDFVSQLEDRMEILSFSKKKLAQKLGKSKGRVSQVFNNPGNLELESIVDFSRALGMKVTIMAYEDNDPDNTRGPINPEIFRICWEKANKPRDFWDLQETAIETSPLNYVTLSSLAEAATNNVRTNLAESDKTMSDSVAAPGLALASNY